MRGALVQASMCGALALVSTAARGEPACTPSVRVSGDPDVASAIGDSLAARGLAAEAATACAPMRANVERRGPRLRVVATDAYGRRSEREVRDTATAVALIESWARPEVVGDELPGAAPDGIARPATTAARTRPATPGPSGLAIVGGVDYAGDGLAWVRGGIAGCVTIGRLCVGARLERARATDLASENHHDRSAVFAAAMVELPLAVGGFAIVPGVGLGGGWATTGDGAGPDQAVSSTSLRAIGVLAIRHRIGGRWAAELELGGELEAISGDPVTPGRLARAGLGLRYGGW